MRRKKREELNFEETVLDEWARDFDVLELPLSGTAFRFLALALVIVGALVLGRLVVLNVIRGELYAKRAAANASNTLMKLAPRGIIVDRYGQPLVENVATFSIALNLKEFFTLAPDQRAALQNELERALGIPAGQVRERLLAADAERSDRVVIYEDLDIGGALRLKRERLPAVLVQDSFRRHYLRGASAAHLLGYTGLAEQSDLTRLPQLHANDIVGKTGLEAEYDHLLRGVNGTLVMLKNAKGVELEERSETAVVPGRSLRLTVDAEFQEYFAERFSQGLAALGRTSGAGLAMNPQNGEILALISLPSFDNNIFVEAKHRLERAAVLGAKTKPLFNRVVSGLYNPASTVKPLHALAALTEQVVTPETEVFSAGYIEIPNPYDIAQPSRFLDWKPHGWVDVRAALARSSNVYFYTVGGGYGEIKGLGIERLREWWQKFLFGTPTGVDLPGEAAGFLPAPDEKEQRTGEIWRIGDTYNVSIGQGDILVTPLQLLNYIAAIANGGKLYRPHLAMDSGQGSEVLADISQYQSAIKVVEQGMIDAVGQPYGTAHLLSDLPFGVAAKTGSAQVEGNQKINALFVGYLPAEALAPGLRSRSGSFGGVGKVGAPLAKQIAILVLVEDAKEGSLNAVPIAKDVLAWYYKNRIVNRKQ